jgi:hypothetical protein
MKHPLLPYRLLLAQKISAVHGKHFQLENAFLFDWPKTKGCEFLLKVIEEVVLIRADLNENDVIEARLDELADRLEVAFGRLAPADLLRHGLGRGVFAGSLEPFGIRQFRLLSASSQPGGFLLGREPPRGRQMIYYAR